MYLTSYSGSVEQSAQFIGKLRSSLLCGQGGDLHRHRTKAGFISLRMTVNERFDLLGGGHVVVLPGILPS